MDEFEAREINNLIALAQKDLERYEKRGGLREPIKKLADALERIMEALPIKYAGS